MSATRTPLANRSRSKRGTVTATLDGFHAYYDLVARVALCAAGDDPKLALSVTTREWNRVRAELDETGPKTAVGVMQAVGKSWSATLRIALAAPSERTKLRVVSLPGEGEPAPDELMIHALKGVAFRAGSSPDQTAYTTWVERIENERVAEYGAEFGLPASVTIEKRFGSWDAAINAAGLDPVAYGSSASSEDLLSILMDCMNELGKVPTKRWFVKWASVRGRRLSQGVRTWRVLIATAKQHYEAEGLDWPETATLAELGEPQPLPGQVVAVKARVYTEAEVLASARAYLDSLSSNQRPTVAGYKQYRREHPEQQLVSIQAIQRWGKTQDVFHKATKEQSS